MYKLLTLSMLFSTLAQASYYDCMGKTEYQQTRFRCADENYIVCVDVYNRGSMDIKYYEPKMRRGFYLQEENVRIKEKKRSFSMSFSRRAWPISYLNYQLYIDRDNLTGSFSFSKSGLSSAEVSAPNLICEEFSIEPR